MVKLVDLSGQVGDLSSIEATAGRPIWRAIALEIERAIRDRRLSPGDKLPTELELSRTYMVNRHTVRRALGFLAERGLIASMQGRGSFVCRHSVQFRIGRRVRFSEFAETVNLQPSTKTLGSEIRPADAEAARALRLRVGDPLITIERLACLNDEPVSISRHNFSHERFPFFIEMYERTGSITKTLRESGVPDYVRMRTAISARLPTPRESEILGLPRHIPVLVTTSINLDGMRRPLEFGEARFAADRVELDVETESDAAD